VRVPNELKQSIRSDILHQYEVHLQPTVNIKEFVMHVTPQARGQLATLEVNEGSPALRVHSIFDRKDSSICKILTP
jgi:hypothetical protein